MSIIKRVLIFAFVAIAASSPMYAKTLSIKVAVLENLKFEKLSTDKYANDYMDGLLTAADTARENGYNVEIKTFFYSKEPLAILKEVPAVKAWNPDVVIGPRSSSLFLTLKDQFDGVLVLSPFATASEVSELPDNFYSMTLPNEFFTQAVANMVRERFPSKPITPVGEVDCKNCMDFLKSFASVAKSAEMTVRQPTTFLNKNAETDRVEELLAHYQRGDVLLLPNTSYTSGTLMGRLSDHIQDNSVVFIGGDGWGDWSSSYVGKVKSLVSYTAYRVTPWFLDAAELRTQHFKDHYKKYRGSEPTGVGALLSYATLMAALDPLTDGKPAPNSPSIRELILGSFKAARSKDPNYGRPTRYAVYKVTQSGETFDGEISALTRNEK